MPKSTNGTARVVGEVTGRAAPTVDQVIASAVGIIAALEDSDEQAARRSLSWTAARAGVSDGEIARGVVLFHTPGPRGR